MLGLVLTPYGKVDGSWPWEISKSVYGDSRQMCPSDPYYLQRGEYGYYYDTQLGRAQGLSRAQGLGAIPTDAELSRYMGWYTPVHSGWVTTNQGYYPAPWVPRRGGVRWWGPQIAPLQGRGLGDATTGLDPTQVPLVPAPAAPAATPVPSAADFIQIYDQHEQQKFLLSALSTAAVVASSLIAFYRTFRLMQQEQRKTVKLIEHEERALKERESQ